MANQKIRVFELARELNIPSKDLITRMKSLDFKVEGNFNVLDDETVAQVKEKLLQPVTRIEEEQAPDAPGDEEEGSQSRKRRIISARRSGEVQKIQESLGVSGPLPEDQRTREEVQAEPVAPEVEIEVEVEVEVAPEAVEAPEPEKSRVRRRIAAQPDEESLEVVEVQQAATPEAAPLPEEVEEIPPPAVTIPEAVIPAAAPPEIAAQPETAKDDSRVRRLEGPLPPEPAREGDEDRTAKIIKRSDRKRAARQVEPEASVVRPEWREMRKTEKRPVASVPEEWVRPRRGRDRGRGRTSASSAAEQRHTFNPRQKAIRLGQSVTVSELAGAIGVRAPEIIRKLIALGMMATVNDSIEGSVAELIAADYSVEVEVDTSSIEDHITEEVVAEGEMESRPPIVTIMGHVDHGKTTLLDTIRTSRIAAKEAGGITQHIGAYLVDSESGAIVFLDTPGHEAFTSLRARGANVTDIVVLIVSADDGIMPQTIEAIEHAKAAEVPILVAVNKIDRPNADQEKIKRQLMEHGLVPEEFGGETVIVPISALTGEGVDRLLEMIYLQSELLECKATRQGRARGVVIESSMDRKRGPVATILVQRGVLKVGSDFVVGSTFGRIRAMFDDQGRQIEQAPPSHPVEILGLDTLPEAGDNLVETINDKMARQLAQVRDQRKREDATTQNRQVRLEDFLAENASSEEQILLPIVLKADTQGSLEALRASLDKEGNEQIKVNMVRAGVGGITETDVNLATTSSAVVIGFNVRAENKAAGLAREEGVDIKTYTIIYELINDIHAALEGMLKPIVREEVIGHCQVKEIFNVGKSTRIAGGIITDGRLEKQSHIRVFRDDVLVHSGSISSLRRHKDDVNLVQNGTECGVGISNFSDVREGDVIEAFFKVEESAVLERAGRG